MYIYIEKHEIVQRALMFSLLNIAAYHFIFIIQVSHSLKTSVTRKVIIQVETNRYILQYIYKLFGDLVVEVA